MDRRNIILDITSKKGKSNIVAMTCYSAQFSSIFDKYADILLVGDSLGMIIYGFENTIKVSLRMMIDHGKAVVKTTKKSLVAIDLPFGTYESSKEKAFATAAKLISKTEANAVKIEGGIELAETIKFLVDRGIPVIGHIGLLPQRIQSTGKFSVKGKSQNEEKKIINDAKSIQKAGAFACVVEAVTENLGRKITKNLSIPTIGIGAGRYCDGQILVTDDLLGLYNKFTPKFVKKYANLTKNVDDAVKKYSKDVISGNFPDKDNIYK
ncbi:MAG: 3-methyl-2-oxobutanoate hydroxymethyltransferase [Rickettsiales bacterium]|nr:3-methyl-2-oxobutanoate hydroxymethyltransferase [Rickettsiales bacterium]|tara:strand:- start:62 stop:859 length:798 start_codon:yes stop_codon:yes gene_type:complete